MGQLYGWLHQLPVIGFNSGKYALNAIKQFLIPHFITETTEECAERFGPREKSEEEDGIGSFFVIKRNNTFMCLSNQLKLLDMTNYIAPGFSCDKYMKTYRYEVTKGYFPYEYMYCLEKLDDTTLPLKEAF